MSEPSVQIQLNGKRGRVVIDGHDVSNGVTYVGVTAPAGQLPTVTLHVDLAHVFVDGEAKIEIPEAIAAALVRLGWTAPNV